MQRMLKKIVNADKRISIDMYELDTAQFLSAPELAWQAC